MSHYRSNLRDLQFNLFEVLGTGERLGRAPFEELDAGTAREILAQVEQLAVGPVAESYSDGDRNPPVYDQATSSVTMPESFRRSYQAYVDAEWWRLDLPAELG
ncbi:MAG: acyl-CoA dehydrogenase family protein, partial [Streptosporangiaceae bacterium]